MAMRDPVGRVAIEGLIGFSYAVISLSLRESEAIANIIETAPSFFALPPAEKAKCQLENSAGYRPYGIEYSNSPERPDEMETFSYTTASIGLPFPQGSAQKLHEQAAMAFRLLESLAERLVAALAERLTGRGWQEALRGGLHRWSTLQINYSRPSEARSEFINEVHEDGHLLTLAHATSEGLELRLPNETFVSVTTEPNQMVVMLGGISSLMTNGRLPPLYHRVRCNRVCTERTSVLFFADLAPEMCRPWIAGENNRSVDIGACVRTNPIRFGLQKHRAD